MDMSPDRLRRLARLYLALRALPEPTGEDRLLLAVLARLLLRSHTAEGQPLATDG